MLSNFNTTSFDVQRVVAVKEFNLRARKPHIPPPTLDFIDSESSSEEEEEGTQWEEPVREAPVKHLNSFKIRKTSESTKAPISAMLITLESPKPSGLYEVYKRKRELISKHTHENPKEIIIEKKIESKPIELFVAAPKSEEVKKIEVIAMVPQVQVQKPSPSPQPLELSNEAREKIKKALDARNYIKAIFRGDRHLSFLELRGSLGWDWEHNYYKRIEIIQGWVDDGFLEYAMISNMTKYSVKF